MIDPFPLPPALLTQAIRPVASLLNLSTLPFHIHEIFLAFLVYHVINIYLGPMCSRRFFGPTYTASTRWTKINWNVHIVSFVQSTLITIITCLVIWKDHERSDMSQQERIVGYTGAGGMVQALVAGYFLWDLMVCVEHFQVLGLGSLLHAISALLVTFLGFVSGPLDDLLL